RNTRQFNRIVGFRFETRTMRNLRFEPSLQLRKDYALPAGFAHISVASETLGGFDALRSILRGWQRRHGVAFHDLMLLASSMPWLARALWWKVVEKRLLFPPRATHHLHVVVEQEPLARNKIALSSDRTDVFGNPLVTIDWRVGKTAINDAIALTQ